MTKPKIKNCVIAVFLRYSILKTVFNAVCIDLTSLKSISTSLKKKILSALKGKSHSWALKLYRAETLLGFPYNS